MTSTKVKTRTNTVAETDSVSKMSITVMAVASGLVGIWAITCLISAAITQGPIELLKGFFLAIGG